MEKLKLTNKEIELINRFALKELNNLLDFCVTGRKLLIVQCGKNSPKAEYFCIKTDDLDSLRDDDYILFVYHTTTCSKAIMLQKWQLPRRFYIKKPKARYFHLKSILQLANSVEL